MSSIADTISPLGDSQTEKHKLVSFSARLIESAEAQGINQAEIVRRTGLSRQIVSDYWKGRKEPGAEAAARIAIALGVRCEWLILGVGAVISSDAEWPELSNGFGEKRFSHFQHQLQAGIKHYLPHNEAVPVDPDTWIVKLPIADLTHCDDYGLETTQENIAISNLLLSGATPFGTGNLMAGFMPTDAMADEIPQGSGIVIDANDRALREGVFVFKYGENLQIKRLRPLGLNKVEILASNDKYSAQIIEGDDLKNFKILGRVCLTILRV